MKELLTLSGMGILALIVDMLNWKKIIFPVVLIGLVATLYFSYTDLGGEEEVLYNMAKMDNFALSFCIVFSATALVWFLLNHRYIQEYTGVTDHFALLLFAVSGALAMVSYTNLTMLFIGIEILSISMYVLAGSQKTNISSNEAAFKYFLMGAFASGFLLFGIALVYGVTGSFDLAKIAEIVNVNPDGQSSLMYVGILMIIAGMGFKISAAPFHFWAPDVYQGSPTPITAFMATIVKTAAIAAFLRLFFTCFLSTKNEWGEVVWVMSALTLVIGNVSAMLQDNVKRMLAFSSISHAGYLLIGLLTTNAFSDNAVLYYTAAYSISSLAAFSILYFITRDHMGDEDIRHFNGLGKKSPLLAALMTISLLSLAGIPPMAGFMAKYLIFSAAIQEGYIGLVLLAVATSLVGVYYYFRVIIAMYFREGEAINDLVQLHLVQKVVLIATGVLSLLFGLFPQLITGLLF